MLQRIVTNYIQRHMHPVNRLLHLVGVPLTFVVSVIFLIRHQWGVAAACFAGGYILQFIGHAIEGNDAGEMVLVKKCLGLPYREFGPLAAASRTSESTGKVENPQQGAEVSKSDG